MASGIFFLLFRWVTLYSLTYVSALRVVGWHLGNEIDTIQPNEWRAYSYIHKDGPHISVDGYASCMPSPAFKQIQHITQKYNVSLLFGGGGIKIHDIIFNESAFSSYRANFLQTIGQAMDDCMVSGIEIDYEMNDSTWSKIGIVTPEHAQKYSEFLWELKQRSGKIVSADVMVWGIAPEDWVLDFWPWVLPEYLNSGKIDWVNSMSYHWSEKGDITAWEKDVFLMKHLYHWNASHVNIGVPYFSQTQLGEPTWGGLSPRCPNIDASLNVCDNIPFVGKHMQAKIGNLARKNDMGVFAWAAPTYDSHEANNTLIRWLTS